ncbi:helix-turn-helix domain-containing protein [Variovorax sp. J22R133]|nr:helix-turn-helix domain-containing protein [Variovorax sp. J22R133]MDM0115748.1 helix-turn-helix domain-containing protein [Variovorax sp. J22R133]
MLVTPQTLPDLAQRLAAERKRQGLTRALAASICDVSTSFIRDAESDPGRCSLGKLVQLTRGLGLAMDISGWHESPSDDRAAPDLPPAASR